MADHRSSTSTRICVETSHRDCSEDEPRAPVRDTTKKMGRENIIIRTETTIGFVFAVNLHIWRLRFFEKNYDRGKNNARNYMYRYTKALIKIFKGDKPSIDSALTTSHEPSVDLRATARMMKDASVATENDTPSDNKVERAGRDTIKRTSLGASKITVSGGKKAAMLKPFRILPDST